MAAPLSADVAELADAQVSEACDGDIVEVQVLSSAPRQRGEPIVGSPFHLRLWIFQMIFGVRRPGAALLRGYTRAGRCRNKAAPRFAALQSPLATKKLATESIRLVFSY